MTANLDRELAELAMAHGVSTSYVDWQQREVPTNPDVIRTVLRLLDIEADTPRAVRRELRRLRERVDGSLPPTVVVRPGARWALPGADDATPAAVTADDGTVHEVRDGTPVELPLGWYRISSAGSEATAIVAPRRLPLPPPAWGWMLQVYALHSSRSWGLGDLADLSAFTEWAAETGRAGLILLNPLHAVNTVTPVQPSPYSPSSRRFINPMYLSLADTAAYRRAPADVRIRVDGLRSQHTADRIDYERVWQAKRAGLELLFRYAESAAEPDPALRDFATFCALAEINGPDWRGWPPALRRPGVAARAAATGDRVAFHAWLQRECAGQLGGVQDRARRAGMPIGLVLDLAVGVDPGGADGWMTQDVLARGVTAGAPPDAFNQQGQDWGLAAWRPDRLAETGYAAYRDVLRAMLRHAGGIRVDHVMGLWRLWWVPPGGSPDQGVYVSYDNDAMLAVLMLEAVRADAAVVAENLGTVQARVTRALAEANIMGSEVLWFARDWAAVGEPFQLPERWPPAAMASISTHDLPTAAGMLDGEHVRIRAALGLLDVDLEAELERARADRRALVGLLTSLGLARDGAADEELVVGMHRLLAASPCRFLLASPYDVLGEKRQPNLPGTVDQYPNWRIPLPMPVEEMRSDPRMREVAALLGRGRPRPTDRPGPAADGGVTGVRA